MGVRVDNVTWSTSNVMAHWPGQLAIMSCIFVCVWAKHLWVQGYFIVHLHVSTIFSELSASWLLLSYVWDSPTERLNAFPHLVLNCKTEMVAHTKNMVHFVWYLMAILIDIWPRCGLPCPHCQSRSCESFLPSGLYCHSNEWFIQHSAVNEFFGIVMPKTFCGLFHTYSKLCEQTWDWNFHWDSKCVHTRL